MDAGRKLDRIDHVAMNVADLQRAKRWYLSSFQCDLLYESSSEAVLQFGNIRLALVLPSDQQTHVAYLRPDAAAFGALMPQHGGHRSTYVSDPSGNIVEIVEEAPE